VAQAPAPTLAELNSIKHHARSCFTKPQRCDACLETRPLGGTMASLRRTLDPYGITAILATRERAELHAHGRVHVHAVHAAHVSWATPTLRACPPLPPIPTLTQLCHACLK